MPPANLLTVVNYHYVHDLERPDFPGLRALDVRRFAGQIAYLRGRHRFVGCEEIRAFLDDAEPLPDAACAVTFDDGLRDHHDHVAPILEKSGIRGLFYVPARALDQKDVLPVHKLHLAMGQCGGPALHERLEEYLRTEHPSALDEARTTFVKTSRFDDEATAFVKWILTSFLPRPSAQTFLDRQFAACFDDEAAVARRLYLGRSDVREMIAAGMHIGGHGDWHYRLDELSPVDAQREIEASLEMIDSFYPPGAVRSFAYPYGGYTRYTMDYLSAREVNVAWATQNGLALGDAGARLCLRRDDTNALPQPLSREQSAGAASA